MQMIYFHLGKENSYNEQCKQFILPLNNKTSTCTLLSDVYICTLLLFIVLVVLTVIWPSFCLSPYYRIFINLFIHLFIYSSILLIHSLNMDIHLYTYKGLKSRYPMVPCRKSFIPIATR